MFTVAVEGRYLEPSLEGSAVLHPPHSSVITGAGAVHTSGHANSGTVHTIIGSKKKNQQSFSVGSIATL